MTEGRILPVMLQFAIPVMIGSLFQNLYNLADMSIAGYTLGDHALAAIAASHSIVYLINAVSMGFNTGNAILISQAFGAGNMTNARKCYAGVLELCIGMIIVMTTVLGLLVNPLLRLVRTPAELFEDAFAYIIIMILGQCASMLYNMYAAVFRSLGNSKMPLAFLIFSSALNVGLDILFIVPLGMGVRGAALATIVAQAISAVLSGIYFYVNYPEMRLRREDFRGNAVLIKEMFPMGAAAAVSNSLFAIGDMAVQGAVNALGSAAIIGQAAAQKIRSFAIIPSIGMANTGATFAAQNYGAGKLDRITKGIYTGVAVNIVVNVFTTAVAFLFGGELIRLVTNTENAEVIANGQLMLRIVVPFIFTQTIVMIYRMSIQGMKRKVIPIIGTAVELCTRFFCALVLAPIIGFLGICFAEPMSWVVSGAVMVIFYYANVMKKEKAAAGM